MPLSLKERLNKILIEKGLLTSEKLTEALKIQKEKGGKLSDILVESEVGKGTTFVIKLPVEKKDD